MRWATDEGKLTSAAVAVVGAGAVLMEITILAGLAALGELSREKLGAAMMIVAVLTAITAHGVHSQVTNRSKHNACIAGNARSLRVTTGLMGRFVLIAAVL